MHGTIAYANTPEMKPRGEPFAHCTKKWFYNTSIWMSVSVVALIMGKNGEKMDFGYGKTFLEKVSWGGPETPFCGISGPIPACGGVYTEKWTKF